MKRTGLLIITLTILALALAACGSPPVEEVATVLEEAPLPEAPAEEAQPADPVQADDPAASEPVAEEPAEAEAPLPDNVFVITPDESEARFLIDEVLNGADNLVVGATNAIEGQMTLDMANAAAAQVGTVRVDLSTLATDNNFRNRALRDFILQTGNPGNQFAEFTPTAISGLPAAANVGESYPVQISGDLTVKGTTSPVTFEGTVTPVSETRLEGSASTTAPYESLGVTIPRLPDQVASVDPNVTLEIDFVALAG